MKIFSWIVFAATFGLMVWGNTVSATGSGLACPDWPLCHGSLFPPSSFEIFLEWGHRRYAALVGVLIATLITVLLKSKKHRTIFKKSWLLGLLGLFGIQVVLGGLTVLLGLSRLASTVHLMFATIILSIVLAIATLLQFDSTWSVPSSPKTQSKLKRMGLATLSAMLVQLFLGGMVRHSAAGLACPAFPLCSDSFFPSPWLLENFLAFAHRWWGVLMVGSFVHWCTLSFRSIPRSKGIASAIILVVLFQILLGIMTVGSGLSTELRAFHAATGYGLWSMSLFMALRQGLFLNVRSRSSA